MVLLAKRVRKAKEAYNNYKDVINNFDALWGANNPMYCQSNSKISSNVKSTFVGPINHV